MEKKIQDRSPEILTEDTIQLCTAVHNHKRGGGNMYRLCCGQVFLFARRIILHGVCFGYVLEGRSVRRQYLRRDYMCGRRKRNHRSHVKHPTRRDVLGLRRGQVLVGGGKS